MGTGHWGGTEVEALAPLLGWEGDSLSRPPAGKAKRSNSATCIYHVKTNKGKKHCRFFNLILKEEGYKCKPRKNPSSHLVHHPVIHVTPGENSRCLLCLPKKNSGP